MELHLKSNLEMHHSLRIMSFVEEVKFTRLPIHKVEAIGSDVPSLDVVTKTVGV